jgi:magnesium chelatase family protein
LPSQPRTREPSVAHGKKATQECSGGFFGDTSRESSYGSLLEIRERVTATRKVQQERFKDQKIYSSAQMTLRLIRQHCEIGDDSRKHLEHAMTKMGLSARAYDRILKISRTLADLDWA